MRIFPNSTQTEEFDQLGGLGFLGSFNDRQYRYLRSLGYDGSLNDMLFFIKNSPVIVSTVPSLFWPINTGQSYNIAQHIVGPGPLTYTTPDTLPAGVTLSSSGVLSGTPTTILTGFIGVIVTAPNGTMLVVPVFLAIQDVPAAFTVGQWNLVPVLAGLRVDPIIYPSDNNSAILKLQYRLDAGAEVDLASGGVITTSGTKAVEIRAVNAIGPGGWSDVKTDTALAYVGDYPTVSLGTNKTQGNATTFTINQPTVAVGDTILHVIAIDGTPTVTVPAGWTIKDERNASNSSNKALVITRTATGSDAVTLDFNGASENAAVKTWVFGGNCAVDLAAATGTSPPNPPSLTLGAAHDVYLIAAVAYEGTSTDLASGAAPSGYSFVGTTANSGTSSAGVSVSAAAKTAGPVTTEDPAAFGGTAAATIAYTIAVYKTVSAPTVATPIPDQTVDQNTGGGAVSVAASFSGTQPLTYSVSGGPTGTSVDSAGLVTFPTGTTGSWTITVTATNSAGSANDPFVATVNAVAIPSATFVLASSVAETFADGTQSAGVSFVDGSGVSTQRLVAQSVTGRWHVIGDAGSPVRYNFQRAFAFEDGITRYHQSSATLGTVAAGTGRYRNGAMLNPTIIRDSKDGYDDPTWTQAAPKPRKQGFDNYMYQSGKGCEFDATLNLNTGSPYSQSAGVMVQSVGLPFTSASDPAQVGGRTTFRTKIVGHFSLAVIPSAPPQNFFAIPPSGANKNLFFGLHAGMVRLNILPANDAQAWMPGRRTMQELCAAIGKLKNSWCQDQDRARSMMADDERSAPYGTASVEAEYSREQANLWGECLAVAIKRQPSSGGDSTAWRDQLVYLLIQDGLDYAAALIAGEDYYGGGGFQTGIKSLVAFAAIMLDLQWLKDLCDPVRPRPISGGLIQRDDTDVAKGGVGYGFAEHKRYFYVTTPLTELTTIYIPTAGRGYPKPYQPAHVGIPDWSEYPTKGAEGFRYCPNWDYQYRENCGSDMSGSIAVHLLTGMNAIYRQPAMLQYWDRAVPAKRANRMRSEAGFTAMNLAIYDQYRSLTASEVAIFNGKPDQPDAPILTQFVGEGTRLGIRLANTTLDNGSAITGYRVRYRTTQPDRFLTDDGGWTVVSGVSLSTTADYFLTGLTAATQYWVQVCAINANGDGPYSTNLRKNVNVRGNPPFTAAIADGYTVPQAVATTSTNQTVTNTVAPTIVGGVSVGQEAVIDHGTWSVQPTGWSYQWKRAGANISGAIARTYTIQSADIGQAITCTVTGVNSSSSLPVTTASRTGTATVTRTVTQIGAGTLFDASAPSTSRRRLALTESVTHPNTVLGLLAYVPFNTYASAIADQLAVLRDAGGTAHSATSGTNEIAAFKSESISGNLRTSARAFSIPTVDAGGAFLDVTLNPSTLKQAGHAMAAFRLAGYDLANARYGGFAALTDVNDTDLNDQMFHGEATVGIDFNASGIAQIVPKGSLIIAVAAAGLHYYPQAPVWGSGLTSVASDIGLVGTARYATVGIATGVQANAGACTVAIDIGGNPIRFALSVMAIPPL